MAGEVPTAQPHRDTSATREWLAASVEKGESLGLRLFTRVVDASRSAFSQAKALAVSTATTVSTAYSETNDLPSLDGANGQAVGGDVRLWQAEGEGEGERGSTMLVRRDGRYVRIERPI